MYVGRKEGKNKIIKIGVGRFIGGSDVMEGTGE